MWIIAIIIILIFGFFDISPLGILIIGIVAFIVLFFAIGQSVGIAQTGFIKKEKKELIKLNRIRERK